MRRRATAVAVAVGCGISIGACGSSGHRSTASTDPQVAISECMRGHGVANFPDPHKGPGGNEGITVLLAPGSSTVTVQGIPFSGPAFKAATKICGFVSGGGNGPPQLSESYRLAALHFAQCMRAHGVPNYPDPTFPDGGGIESGNGPQISRNAPAVLRATKACNSRDT